MKTFLTISILLAFYSSLTAKEVSITIEGKTLCGELNVSGQIKSRAVFILAGSSNTDRDGNIPIASAKTNNLKYLAKALNEQGITTLKVDKRGVGASAAIQESDLRFSTYVEDAKHWIKFLEKQGYGEIILLGHGEGALVATLAASSKSVKGLVCIAAAGRPASVILQEEFQSVLPRQVSTTTDKVITSLSEGNLEKDSATNLRGLHLGIRPYLISLFKIDPLKEISKVQVPVLIVQGTTDLKIKVKDAELLNAAAKESTLIIIKGMNHFLKEIKGDIAAQKQWNFIPDTPLHKDLMKGIIEFINTIKEPKQNTNREIDPLTSGD